MTVYVFDSGPLIDIFRHYYRDRFPSLWQNFDGMVEDGRITSTREVSNELAGHEDKSANRRKEEQRENSKDSEKHEDELAKWCKENRRKVFITPTPEELEIVREIFGVRHFQAMIRKKQRLEGRPVADPFVIARAKCLENGCVVTKEKHKPNAPQIPNVCDHFGVDWTDLEGFMEREQWRF